MATLFRAAVLAVLISALSTVEAEDEPFIQPQKALLPAVHWDHNKTDIQNLVPVDSHKLYYSAGGTSDPTLEHVFALLSTKIVYPAGDDLNIMFTDNNAYTFAKNAWTEAHDVVLVTDTNGCSTSSEQRTFWLIDKFVTGICDTCITAMIDKEIAVESAFDEVDMIWGTYTPGNGSVASSIEGSNAPAPSSSSGEASPSRASPQLGRRQPNRRQISGNATTGNCGPAPSAKIDGLFTATCDSTTFDQDLDNAIGYLDFDSAHYSSSLQDFVPGLDDYAAQDNPGFDPVPSRLRPRIFRKVASWFKQAANAIANRFEKKAQELISVAENLVNNVKGAAKTAVKAVYDALAADIQIKSEVPISISAPNANLAPSPFGNSLQFYEQQFPVSRGKKGGVLKAFCVQCGADGIVRLSGNAKWALKGGLQQLNVGMNGNFQAGLSLGISADLDVAKQTFSRTIATKGVPGFWIPHVFAIGPQVELAIEAELAITLAGQILAGANVSIPNFAATVDFINGSRSTSSGFTPKFTPNFQASGEISATASLGLPVMIGVGVFIPGAKFRQAAGIGTKPAIELTMSYAASTQGGDCNNGVSIATKFVNRVYAEIPKFKYNIKEDNFTLPDTCLRLGSKPNNPSGGTTRRSLPEHPHFNRRQAAEVGGPDPFSFVTGPETNATANDTIWQAANVTAFQSLQATIDAANTSDIPFSPDATFVYITTLSGENELAADEDDGNLYYANPGYGSLFGNVSGVIEGDVNGNFFHYYNDSMAVYNVSRFRFSNETHIPRSSDFVGLVPINYDANNQTADVLIALDTIGTIFYPVTCDIQGQNSKAFLVKDIQQGIQKLQDPSLRYTVTGGIVQTCYFLPWAAPPGSAQAFGSNSTSNATSAAAASSMPAAAASTSVSVPDAAFTSVDPYFASLKSAAAAATSSGSNAAISAAP